ncbi:MAG: methyltransferase domain-containing protein [Gaiellaceae bacterium]
MARATLHRLRTAVRPLVPRRFHALATRAVGHAIALALKGNRVSCPCCGARLRRFVVYPSLYCPRCGSYERHRLLALHLQRHPELLAPPLRLLQVSPDRPLARLLIREGIERVSIDIDNPNVDLEMDVHELAFPDETFDAVLALSVLDAVADQPQALAELHRVLRRGGRAIFQVSVPEQPRLAASLIEAGFDTEIVRPADFGADAVATYALIPEEETYLCRKPLPAGERTP